MAQLNAVITGDALDIGNNCYTITPDGEFLSGGVWYDNPIDFDSDFTIFYQNNFGFRDSNGADGMALVFKGNSTPVLGGAGGGLGYAGITPSLVIEFDTWQNTELGDPSFDHISIMRNGEPNHNNPSSNLSGPIQASATSFNIEDDAIHEVKIEWSATTKILNVYFDCQLRLSLNQDVKNTIFSGDDTVFFGFVGSTGGASNIHQVCFNSISFVENLQLQDTVICDVGSVEVDATIPSGSTYSWTPTNGVSDSNSPNPTLSPTMTTTYTVAISDICGETTTEEVTISVFSTTDSIFDPVDSICEGDTSISLPTTSNNGISGTWSPAINNTATTLYTFTPDPNQCANSATLEIMVNPLINPIFDIIEAICEGDTLADLPLISNNGISGTWSPTINNTMTTAYTFTPDPGGICLQQATLEIVVNPIITPVFEVSTSICEGEFLGDLPIVSVNGISGVWSPALNNTMTTLYTFVPDSNPCASSTTLEIEVLPNVVPVFSLVDSICEGDTSVSLPTMSDNGITGTWNTALNTSETTTYTFTPSLGECAIEATWQIVVNPLLTPIFDAVLPICPGEPLEELATTSNNGISGTWSPNLDNTQTTVYTFVPDVGQGCVIETTLQINIVDPIVPIFSDINPVCEGDTITDLPIISNNGISGVWSPALNSMVTTIYTFTPNDGQCSASTVLEIQVIPISEIFIEVEIISEAFSDNQTVVASVNGGTGLYEYQLDNGLWQEDAVFNTVFGCDEHVIKARETSRCSNVALEAFRILEYPKFFTPNNDSVNDSWNIDCLRDQVGAKISIYDRYGKVLAVLDPSRFGWDGIYNDALMPTNDYWFKVEYIDKNGLSRTFASHFTLKR